MHHQHGRIVALSFSALSSFSMLIPLLKTGAAADLLVVFVPGLLCSCNCARKAERDQERDT